MKKILILSSGNSCRSQMAEAYLKYYTQNKVDVYSAGLEDIGLHLLAQTVMAEDGLDISNYPSDNLKKWSGVQFDYLISVGGDLERAILEIFPKTNYLVWNFPDPGIEELTNNRRLLVFREVREAIKTRILQFIGNELDLMKASSISIAD